MALGRRTARSRHWLYAVQATGVGTADHRPRLVGRSSPTGLRPSTEGPRTAPHRTDPSASTPGWCVGATFRRRVIRSRHVRAPRCRPHRSHRRRRSAGGVRPLGRASVASGASVPQPTPTAPTSSAEGTPAPSVAGTDDGRPDADARSGRHGPRRDDVPRRRRCSSGRRARTRTSTTTPRCAASTRRSRTDYPPIAPAVDWGETYATDPFVTSAIDASILPSSFTWHYRVMAYDILNDPVSASPVRVAHIEARDSTWARPTSPAGDGVHPHRLAGARSRPSPAASATTASCSASDRR